MYQLKTLTTLFSAVVLITALGCASTPTH